MAIATKKQASTSSSHFRFVVSTSVLIPLRLHLGVLTPTDVLSKTYNFKQNSSMAGCDSHVSEEPARTPVPQHSPISAPKHIFGLFSDHGGFSCLLVCPKPWHILGHIFSHQHLSQPLFVPVCVHFGTNYADWASWWVGKWVDGTSTPASWKWAVDIRAQGVSACRGKNKGNHLVQW